MTTCMILGMHASGTSLVAHVLREMGVFMGYKFMGPVKGVETWEDTLFVNVNAKILAEAGGDWANPPEPARVEEVCTRISHYMRKLAGLRDAIYPLWGFKDPRACLTVRGWHRYLREPRYVYTHRDHSAIANSILARGPSKKTFEEWVEVARYYDGQVAQFLTDTGAHSFRVAFEDIVREATADRVLEGLARWLDLGNPGRAVERGLEVIKFR